MGIRLKGDWFQVVSKTRSGEQERIEKGFPPRLAQQIYNNPENIHQSAIFEAHALKYGTLWDEEGNVVARTERTKRRHLRGSRANGKTP